MSDERETLDKVAAMNVVCPQCQNTVEIDAAGTIDQPICGACGSTMRVAADETSSQASEPSLGCLGPYELLAIVGEGGFGTVYKAMDTRLGRVVAIKVPRAGRLTGFEERSRFLREARAVALLRHSAIVSIHDIGDHDGLPYLVCDFLAGFTLAELMTAHPFTPREAARVVAEVADALQYAHEQGLVHRDVKPSNIMVGEDGQVYLMDFGLARCDVGEMTVTMTIDGQILGTPAYMSPEQARGESHQVDGRSDLYSLGVVLYQLLSGKLPFQGNPRKILDQVLNNEPSPPRSATGLIPRDLATIAMKAMEKAPSRRYDTAADLAADLRRFLRDEPILARRLGPLALGLRWVRREPTRALLALFCLVAPLAVAWGVAWSRQRLIDARVESLVAALEVGETSRVPELLKQPLIRGDRARRVLEARARSLPIGSPGRLNLALALLPAGPEWALEVEPWSFRAGPGTLGVIRDGLARAGRVRTGVFWALLEDQDEDRGRRFRAACLLASVDPENPRWGRHRGDLVEWLIAEDPTDLGRWAEFLSPLRDRLREPLRAAWIAPESEGRRDAIALALATLIDEPDGLVELIREGDPRSFGPLVARLCAMGTGALAALGDALSKSAGSDPEGATRGVGNLAISLLVAGPSRHAWLRLKHREDDRIRTYLIHNLAAGGVPSQRLSRQLEVEADPSIRQALILALGEYDPSALPPSQRDRLIPGLEATFRDDPDCGVHSAAGWLLRRWGRQRELGRIEARLAKGPRPSGRRWFVNGEGITLAILPGPVEFVIGAPPGEANRRGDEPPTRRRIGRSFAIATTEITAAQLAAAHLLEAKNQQGNREGDAPANSIRVASACMYCRVLSEREHLPESEMCYPPPDQFLRDGLKPYPDYLLRKGYRLPTESEWEYACRAGSTTARPFGETAEMLPHYAWFFRHTNGSRAAAVGILKPNDFGLHDMLGNVAEWCQDSYRDDHGAVGVEDVGFVVGQIGEMRVVRGGSYLDAPSLLRSARREQNPPTNPLFFVGFRIARSIDDRAL